MAYGIEHLDRFFDDLRADSVAFYHAYVVFFHPNSLQVYLCFCIIYRSARIEELLHKLRYRAEFILSFLG